MANINSFNKTIGELEEKIARLNSFYEEQARILEANRDSANYSSIQSQSYREEEQLTKELGGSLEVFMKKISDITNRGLEDIEDRLEKHNLEKDELLKKDYETEKKFIEDRVKDEEQKRKLLLALDKEYNKKVEDLEKTEYEKRKNLIKSSLAGENQTVFEQLNERFEKEKEEYEKHGLDTLELEKAYNKKRAKLFLNQSQQLVGAISNLVNAGEAQLKEIEETWGVTNQAAHDYGKAVGLNADQIRRLHDETISWMSDNDITEQFNIGADEMFKLMGSYNQQLGRAVALTNDAKINLVSMRNVIGEEQAIKFTTNLDKFGLDVDATKDLVEGVVGDARRSGIVLSNLTQNVADNLYLAQQYTFEDGIEGLVRMAEKATAVKWNMEQTAAFAEKVNNVEGAIKTGAQLSVLGGPFAQFSNPMGMLYESLNDMEGLQDRMFAMFGNLGEWNQEKGMLDISAFDKQRIRAAASAMGLNYSEVINNVNQQARRNVVMDQIKGYGLDENTTELIANTAQIDRDTGRAYVMYNNEKVFANEIGGRGDKNQILDYLQKQANSSDENLRDIAHNTLGAKEMVEAVEKEFVTDRADFFRSIGISKEGVAETHEKIMYAKYGLDKVNQVLSVILGVVQAIAAVSAFRGMFGGSTGAGLGAGARGTAGGVGGFGKLGTYSSGKSLVRQYGSASAARSAIRTSNIKSAVGGVGVTALAMGGTIGGGLMNAQADRLREKGLHEDADNVNLGAGALTGMGTGAAIGATVGSFIPVIGNVVGGIVGGLIGGAIGLFSAGMENEENAKQRRIDERNEEIAENIKKEKEDIYLKTGVWLNGDYDMTMLKAIRRGRNNYSHTMYKVLEENGDGGVIEQLPTKAFAQGGTLNGPSHAEGGMNVIDNQTGNVVAEVEGKEGVVPKSIMEKFGTVANLINSAMRPLQPMGETLSVEHTNNTPINSSLNVGGSANVNVGGLIQLTMTGGQTYNIADDPAAMRMIGDNVMRHIMTANQQIFNKSEFYRKW